MERRAFLATTGAAFATLHPDAVERARAAAERAAGRTPEQVADDEDVGLLLADDRDRVGAFHMFERTANRRDHVVARLSFAVNQMRDDLGISVAGDTEAARFELGAELHAAMLALPDDGGVARLRSAAGFGAGSISASGPDGLSSVVADAGTAPRLSYSARSLAQ